jgi:hypothetical protein
MKPCHICEKDKIPFLSWLFGRRVCKDCEYLEWQSQMEAGLIVPGSDKEKFRKGRKIIICFRGPKDLETFVHSMKGNLNIKVTDLGF